MPEIYIDLEDIYGELSKREKKELADWLVEDGYTVDPITTSKPSCLVSQEFNKTCSNIANSYYRMSNEDIELIEKICKKYISY